MKSRTRQLAALTATTLAAVLIPIAGAVPAGATSATPSDAPSTASTLSTGTFTVSDASGTGSYGGTNNTDSTLGTPPYSLGDDTSDSTTDAGTTYPCYGGKSVWLYLSGGGLAARRMTFTLANATQDMVVGVYQTASPTSPALSALSAAATGYAQGQDLVPSTGLYVGRRVGNVAGSTSFEVQADAQHYYYLYVAHCNPTPADDASLTAGSVDVTYASTAQPANDAFANATALTSGSPAAVTNVAATLQASEPSGYSGSPGPTSTYPCWGDASVWYKLTNPGTGHLQVTSTGTSFDGTVAVFEAPVGTAAVNGITLDTDIRVGTVSTAEANLQHDTVAGNTYWVRIETCNPTDYQATSVAQRGTSSITATFTAAPANDDWPGAVISGATGSAAGDITAATEQTGEYDCNSAVSVGNDVNKSVWYDWTAPASGQYVFDTHGAPFNTDLCIGTKSSAVTGQGYDLGTNDNVSNAVLTSKVQISVTSGTEIAVRVSGVDDSSHPSTGAFTLYWAPAADTTPPTVGITSPANHSNVALNSSAFAVQASATDTGGSGVKQVVFTVQGSGVSPQTVLTPSTGSTYQAVFNLTGVPAGSYTVSAVATDNALNVSAESDITVTVGGAVADTTAPGLVITSPANGAVIPLGTKSLPVSATATDNAGGSGVKEVAFTITGIGTQTVPAPSGGSYSTTFDISGLAAGVYSVVAKATDNSANVSSPASVSFSISVPSGYAGPTTGTGVSPVGNGGVKGSGTTTVNVKALGIKGGSAINAAKKGSKITIHFVGHKLALHFVSFKRAGIVKIAIDGKASTLNLYRASRAKDLVKLLTSASGGLHTVTITVIGKVKPSAGFAAILWLIGIGK